MISSKSFLLISAFVCTIFNLGCRLTAVRQELGECSYRSKTTLITLDGQIYTKQMRDVVFSFAPDKVSYQYLVDGQVLKREFEVSLSKMSYDHCYYYYSNDINNLFVLDKRRRTIQVFGSNKDGKGRLPYSGHTYLDIRPIDETEPVFARN